MTHKLSERVQLYLAFFILTIIFGSYLVYMETGCAMDPVMTWHGKECVQ